MTLFPRLSIVHEYLGPKLHARTIGADMNIVTEEIRQAYKRTGDMSHIIQAELPYIMKAEKIYFLTTSDMHKRPITWAEYQLILDNPELLNKTVVIPLD